MAKQPNTDMLVIKITPELRRQALEKIFRETAPYFPRGSSIGRLKARSKRK